MQEEREAKYGFGKQHKQKQQNAGPAGEDGHYGPAAGSGCSGGGGGKRGGGGGGGGGGGAKRSRAGIGAMPTTVRALAWFFTWLGY